MSIPEKTTVLVMGGGPAGSYASTLLAREGIDVVQMEALKHPRHHVGESMLPSMRHYLRFIGLEEEFEARKFIVKPGAVFKLVNGEPPCYTDFQLLGPEKATWHVVRAESDELMWNYAASQGVKTFDETRIEAIQFEDDKDPKTSRPVSATWSAKSGSTGTIEFDWLIDASGRRGVMSTKYLENRIFREGLRNVGVYGYWRKIKTVNGDSRRDANATWIEALTDQTGWAWIISLHDGTTSIGVVMHEEASKAKKFALSGTLEEHYLQQLKLAPGVMEHIGTHGQLVAGSVKSTVDYSYHATTYSGDHCRIAGDAAAFVDPLFSSGVHVAMTGALSAACTILGSMKGQVTEAEARSWHDAKIGICQTRFLLVVLSTYQHMQNSGTQALVSDLDPGHFNYAFDFFRPLYQGEHDVSTTLTNEELQRMIDFTRNLFTATTTEQRLDVTQRLKKELTSLGAPVIGPEDLDKVLETNDSDAKAVLRMINAMKVLKQDHSPVTFTSEVVNGYVVNLERGALGLTRV